MRSAPLVAALLVLAPPLRGAPRPVALDFIFGDEGEAIAEAPDGQWTRDGDVVFRDPRRPKADRTLETYRLETGTRHPVDPTAALDSLRAAGAEPMPEELEWPASLDGGGSRAVYVYGGDLYGLDLAASRFERITRTDAEEKAPRLSPDGRSLAFVRDNDLWTMDLATGAEKRLTSDGTDTVLNGRPSWVYWEEILDHDDAAYWWSPDSSALAFLRSDESPVSQMSWVDFQPAVPRVLHQRYPKVGGENPIVRLGIVEPSTGRTAWLDSSTVPYEYLVQVRWTGDGRGLGVETLNRAQDRSDLYLVDRATAAARHVLTRTDPAWVNLTDFHFFEDGSGLVATADDEAGHTHLHRYDLEGRPRHALTSGGWSVRGPRNWQFSTLAASVDEARGVAYFTARRESLTERQLYRVRLDGSGLAPVSREPGSHKVAWSPDFSHYLDWHSSRTTPASVSVHDSSGSTTQVLAAAPSLSGLEVRPPELLTIPASDGTPLQARLYTPAGLDRGRRHPLILYLYGEPNAPAVVDAWPDWPPGSVLYEQLLLQEGFLVAAVDSRVATGATRRAETSVLRRVSGAVEISDIVDAVRWLKGRSFVDPDRVGVWGWSGGGTSTLLAMTRSEEFKAGIAVAPVSERRYYDTKYAEAYMKTPQENGAGYDEVSLVRRAPALHGRLLLAFGTWDDNVHPQNSLAFADELIAAGKPFDVMVYPMRKHDIADRAARRDLYRRMIEFWKRWL